MERNGLEKRGGSGIEPLPEKPMRPAKTNADKKPRSRGKKWVPKTTSVLESKVKEEEQQMTPDMRSDDEVRAQALQYANKWELARLEQEIKQQFIVRLAECHTRSLQSQVTSSEIAGIQQQAAGLAAHDIALKYRFNVEKEKLIEELALKVAIREKQVQEITSADQLQKELDEKSIEFYGTKARMTRVPYEEGLKNAQAETAFLLTGNDRAIKTNESLISMVKSELQLKQSELSVAPNDNYVLSSASGLKFELKRTSFQYEWRPAILLLITICVSALSFEFMPALFIALSCVITFCLASVVCFQIACPTLRYSAGDVTYFSTRDSYAEVPGKPCLPGDFRIANDRRDLIQYDGLVRFCDVERCYVKQLKLLRIRLPIRVHVSKTTTVAVSVGLMQQVITKRVSYQDSEEMARSKIEYNMTNMTFVNVDKELMFINHPDTDDKHGFAVFQDTVDFAWGWFMSSKHRTRNVPRPRVVVAQPTY